MRYTVAFVALVVVCVAASAAEPERYRLKGDIDFRSLSRSSGRAEYVIPFDKTYEELTPVQQGRLKSAYVEMGNADEPPFPTGGLQALYKPITAGQERGLMATGLFRAEVEIDEQGNPVTFAVYDSPDDSVTKFVANIVMLTRFKPAICSGSPCKMGFPVRISFETR